MGWSGASGLGKREQGIINPIEGGEVRDRVDMYKGVGLQSDPFEQFRKNRSQTYIQRIRERDEERESKILKYFCHLNCLKRCSSLLAGRRYPHAGGKN